MELEKVFEVLEENKKRKFWGTLEINFRGGVPDSISKTQKILFDNPKNRQTPTGEVAKEADSPA